MEDNDYYDNWVDGKINLGNKGFLYEDAIYATLREFGNIVPPGFSPAGADNTAPDLKIYYSDPNRGYLREIYNVEIKLDTSADYGQSGLTYNMSKKRWQLSGANTKQSEVMRTILRDMGAEEAVNKAWGSAGAPRKFSMSESALTLSDIERDVANFPSTYIKLNNLTPFFDFYGAKKIYYLQVGKGYGMYYMKSDPANLKQLGVKRFDGTLKLRIRTKTSKSNPFSYRFSTALLIDQKPTKSKFNLENIDHYQLLG